MMDLKRIIKSTIIYFVAFFVLIWNIDYIWQINYEPVKQFQQSYFSNKYEMEQMKTKLYSINSEKSSTQKIKIHDLQFELDQTRGDLASLRNELRVFKKTGLDILKGKIKAQIDLIDSLDIDDQSEVKRLSNLRTTQ